MTEKLILYRTIKEDVLVKNMIRLLTGAGESGNGSKEKPKAADESALCLKCVARMITCACEYGLSGSLWQNYLTYLLVQDENAYSLSCERHSGGTGSLSSLAVQELRIVREMMNLKQDRLREWLSDEVFAAVTDFHLPDRRQKKLDPFVSDEILRLCRDIRQSEHVFQFQARIERFYREFGVGELGLNKAFGLQAGDGPVQLVPIANMPRIALSDLVGYEIAKKKLTDNTESFLQGQKANNCLLFGDAGTGKSTSIKALLHQYYARGLRVIELYKHQFHDIGKLLTEIENRNYKFILFMDDLSFEEFETEYKYLKAVIEGGLQKKPDHVLIYATSNRRHLVKEMFSDKEGRRDLLHASDTVQEKLSLAGRFGVTIFFGAPDKKEFQEIVKVLAKKHGVFMEEEVLLLEANKWELSHGGLSGRTAQQFIDYLSGESK